jgi:hypothetical protein
MPLVATSASGLNGDGYGALLAFDLRGNAIGKFSSDDRIEDPRGLGYERELNLLFLNSGADHLLAIDAAERLFAIRDGSRDSIPEEVTLARMGGIMLVFATSVASWPLARN